RLDGYPDIHRGNQSCALARTDGVVESIDHCRGNLERTNRQLDNRKTGAGRCDRGNDSAFVEWAIWLALDVFCCGHSLNHFLHCRVVHPGKPTMACKNG